MVGLAIQVVPQEQVVAVVGQAKLELTEQVVMVERAAMASQITLWMEPPTFITVVEGVEAKRALTLPVLLG